MDNSKCNCNCDSKKLYCEKNMAISDNAIENKRNELLKILYSIPFNAVNNAINGPPDSLQYAVAYAEIQKIAVANDVDIWILEGDLTHVITSSKPLTINIELFSKYIYQERSPLVAALFQEKNMNNPDYLTDNNTYLSRAYNETTKQKDYYMTVRLFVGLPIGGRPLIACNTFLLQPTIFIKSKV
jgi:hypothetical protein